MAMVGNGGTMSLCLGADDLPADIAALGNCLAMVDHLLAEKAAELEPSWSEALVAGGEIDTLLGLEAAIAERSSTLPARSLDEVRAKLAIWEALTERDAEAWSCRDRIVFSVADDLRRF